MSRRSTLRGRIIASYVAVVVAVVGIGALTSRLLMPTLFEQRVRAGLGRAAGRGPGPGGRADQTAIVPVEIQDAFDQALTATLIISAAVGIVLAGLLAVWLTRRMLRHLDEMQRATGRLAAGDYRHPIAVPEEAELAGLAISINRLGSELAGTEQTRARLISDLAHELRNPLATIEGYMEGLIDGVLPPTADTFTTVAEEAHRLQRLTKDLSLVARAQEGRLELSRERVDLGVIVRAVTDRLRPQFEAKSVRLDREMTGSLPVTVDPERITQALTNVVGNALTHTPEGGTVTVRCEPGPGVGRVVVRDTGAGIDPGRLEEIFQRFTRLDAGSSGTGIGLNIARTIARLHGGDLTAHSDGPGTGATFILTLAVAD